MYWVAGGISALSVLLEKKARRGELALYVLPRAGDSLWYILVNRHFLPDVKNAEVLLFYNWNFHALIGKLELFGKLLCASLLELGWT